MQFNVAKLLKSPPGTERRYSFEEEERRFEEVAGVVRGEVRLMRTDRGVLVMAHIETATGCTCSRCVSRYLQPVAFDLEEEFFPTVDIVTGTYVDVPDDGSFAIDHQHVLDLGEAVRQYAILTVPMKPLCRDECAGLCAQCGVNRNQRQCDCPATQSDPRWSKLAALRLQLGEA